MPRHSRTRIPTALAGLVLSSLLAAPLSAIEPSAQVFDDSGQLYEVFAGRYGELFPDGDATSLEHPVLALRVTAADGVQVLHLVPGTEGPQEDRDPTVVHDAGQVFVLWAQVVDELASELDLVSFGRSGFGEVIEVSGDPRQLKGAPRLAITRDPYTDDAVAVNRTIVHLLWWESQPAGVQVFYTPIVLLDGEYLGWNPVVALDAFDLNAASQQVIRDSALYRAANIERGTDGRSVVVALPQQRTGRLMTLRMRVLPRTLVTVADGARSHIVGIGRTGGGSILKLADAARSHIVGIGRMHQGVLDYVADRVYATVLSYGASYTPGVAGEIADLAWQTTLVAGASILGNGLHSDELPCSFLFLGDAPSHIVGAPHQVEVCLASDRTVPETDERAPHTIYVSESGESVLVAWDDDPDRPEGAPAEALSYRESSGAGWSDAVTVSTTGPVTKEQALALLRQQIRIE
ncbi:MAG TPA: hypothetical protein VNB06_05930 [Thermoanaerobaculia bacterium]|nr:hypothetical protein [Thermoanaerobaculia bacterium]